MKHCIYASHFSPLSQIIPLLQYMYAHKRLNCIPIQRASVLMNSIFELTICNGYCTQFIPFVTIKILMMENMAREMNDQKTEVRWFQLKASEKIKRSTYANFQICLKFKTMHCKLLKGMQHHFVFHLLPNPLNFIYFATMHAPTFFHAPHTHTFTLTHSDARYILSSVICKLIEHEPEWIELFVFTAAHSFKSFNG